MSTGGVLPCMKHQNNVCVRLLHVGKEQYLTTLIFLMVLKSLLCFLCATSSEDDEVVVSLMDSGVPETVCHVMLVRK